MGFTKLNSIYFAKNVHKLKMLKDYLLKRFRTSIERIDLADIICKGLCIELRDDPDDIMLNSLEEFLNESGNFIGVLSTSCLIQSPICIVAAYLIYVSKIGYSRVNSISTQRTKKYLEELGINVSSHPEKLNRLRRWLRKVHLEISAFELAKFELQDKKEQLMKIITDAVLELLEITEVNSSIYSSTNLERVRFIFADINLANRYLDELRLLEPWKNTNSTSENVENTSSSQNHHIYSERSSAAQSTEIHETDQAGEIPASVQLPKNLSQVVPRRKRPRSYLNVSTNNQNYEEGEETSQTESQIERSVSQSTEIDETDQAGEIPASVQLPGNLSQDVPRRKRPRSYLNVSTNNQNYEEGEETSQAESQIERSVSQSTEIHETDQAGEISASVQLPGNLSQDVPRRKRPRSYLNVLGKTWLSEYQLNDIVLVKVPNYWWLAAFVKYKDHKMLIVQVYPYHLFIIPIVLHYKDRNKIKPRKDIDIEHLRRLSRSNEKKYTFLGRSIKDMIAYERNKKAPVQNEFLEKICLFTAFQKTK